LAIVARRTYKSYWAEQCRLEEEKSQEIFEKKQEWLENLELEEDTESNIKNESPRSYYEEGRVKNNRFKGSQNNFRKPTHPARYNQIRGNFRNTNINTRRNVPSSSNIQSNR